MTSASDRATREVKVQQFVLALPVEDKDLPQRILDKNPNAVVEGQVPGGSMWVKVLTSGIPLLLIVGLWLFIMRQMQVGGNRAFSFGKSRARMFGGDKPRMTFNDVAGCDEAKEELQEIIEFLRDPKKFQKLGGRIPKGRSCGRPSGHGQDAARTRGRRRSQRAVLLDERLGLRRDVRGRGRVACARPVRDRQEARAVHHLHRRDRRGWTPSRRGLGGGHDEREQTLNQLLVEMDGFEATKASSWSRRPTGRTCSIPR